MNNEKIRLEDFCNMEQLYSILENWSKSTGISSFVVDCEGNRISKLYEMSEYCSLICSNETGRKCCMENWKTEKEGVYECHAGFLDFALPITTPDGCLLGRVLAGQMLTEDQEAESIIQKVTHLSIPEKSIKDVLLRTPRKTQYEIEGSYYLLKQMIDFFIEKSYSVWKDNETFSGVIATAGIGLWKMVLFDGEKPRMSCTRKMLELLGIEDMNLSEEETYDAWFSRIKNSALPSVNASVSEMMTVGKSENTYAWIHPTLGERFVRCGGTGEKVEGKGYILSGYHSDVTDIINTELKQKQLLADALEKTEEQKKLLQQALDNYKQADYDRRIDFLTGLRNRQDMYEMLNDELSGKRKQLKAIFMMDIDNFKLLNDHYGHLAGDDCLRRIGEALNDYGKENAMYFYRYGGEEMLGMNFGDKKSADEIAKELVSLVYELHIERADVPIGVVTISLGYTTNNSEFEKMIDRADTAMYEAKAKGKNQAMCFEKM